MQHRFHLHQLVRAKVLFFEKRRNGIHAIVRLLPPLLMAFPFIGSRTKQRGPREWLGNMRLKLLPDKLPSSPICWPCVHDVGGFLPFILVSRQLGRFTMARP